MLIRRTYILISKQPVNTENLYFNKENKENLYFNNENLCFNKENNILMMKTYILIRKAIF